jgi:hypothetical protein
VAQCNYLGEGDSDSSVSTPPPVDSIAAVINSVDALSVGDPVTGVSAPLSVPHLFWRASAASNSGLIKFDCLVDNGSHLVLICDSLVDELALMRQKLHGPFETELAMWEGEKKVVVCLYEYVKLCLCNTSGDTQQSLYA